MSPIDRVRFDEPTPLDPDLLPRRQLRTAVAPAILLIAITIAAYLPALRGVFVWDDQAFIVENPVLIEPDALWRIWTASPANHEPHYWPVTYTTFWLEMQLWDLRPFGFHLSNVLLHAVNSILVWLVLRRLAIPGAWLAAALFALHPVRVESVAWIIERKDVLSGCFYLLALVCYLRFERAGSRGIYCLSIGLFVCAMLSKSIAVSLPAALALLVWWKRDRPHLRDFLPLLPFVVVTVVLVCLDLHLLHRREVSAFGHTPIARVLLAGRALWFYAAKLHWPSQLTATYSRWEVDVHDPQDYLCVWAALALVIGLWCIRRRVGKGPLVAALFFGATLVPVLGFVDFEFMRVSLVADRFQYLAGLGPITLWIAAVSVAARRWPISARRTGCVFAGLLLVVLGVLTWRQSGVYRSNATFWRANVERNPESWAARYNLGVQLSEAGHPPEEVIDHLLAALKLESDIPEAHNRLGMEYARRNDLDAAVWHFGEALRIDPDYADAASNLARAHHHRAVELAGLGRVDAAIEHFHAALRIRPDAVNPRYDLAVTLVREERAEEAVRQLDELLRLSPRDAEARALRERLRARVPQP